MIGTLVAAIGVAAAVVFVYLRHAARSQAAIERRFASLDQRLDTEREEARRRELELRDTLSRLATAEDMTQLQEQARTMQAAIAELRTALADESSLAREEVRQLATQVTTELAARREKPVLSQQTRQPGQPGEALDLAGEIDRLAEACEELRTGFGVLGSRIRPEAPAAAVLDAVSGKSREEILDAARSLAVLRPLLPYPGWRFDIDLRHPDLAFQTRRAIWDSLLQRGGDHELVVEWYGGTRLHLQLGNDIGSQIFIAGCLDPNEFALLDRVLEPGMTFLDAGANEGIYTVFAARKVGPAGSVWAFEPSSREMARLRRNLSLNGLEAHLFSSALADFTGDADLCLAESKHAGQNTLGGFAYSEVRGEGSEQVTVQRLDDIAARHGLEHLDVLKVDVEGAELRLFRGAEATLRRLRPLLLFEVSEASLRHQGASRRELLEYLSSLGYEAYRFDLETGLPLRAPAGVYADNMIAAPSEKSLPPGMQQLLPAQNARQTVEPFGHSR